MPDVEVLEVEVEVELEPVLELDLELVLDPEPLLDPVPDVEVLEVEVELEPVLELDPELAPLALTGPAMTMPLANMVTPPVLPPVELTEPFTLIACAVAVI